MLIKICGVRDPDTAFFAAENGADFIGMILTPGYERSVSILDAKRIAEAARRGGAEPVAIFVSETAEKIEAACAEMQVEMVQCYHSALLAPYLKRLYVNEPYAALRQGKDFLLIESENPGSGTKIDPRIVVMPEEKEFFLAGGLTPSNVQEMIALYRPSGVDVSSGVEKDKVKNRDLILEFIQKVKSHG